MRNDRRLKRLLAAGLAVSMIAGGITVSTPTEAQAAEPVDDWEQIQEVVGRYYGEWNEPTYSGLVNNQMPDTALLGNGDVGVASGGNSNEKSFYVSKGDFWAYGSSGTLAEPGMLALGGVTISQKPDEETETDVNLALGYDEVSASSVHDNFVPENAVDGTMKDGNDMWCTVIGKEHWMQLYFETPITFSRWVVKFDEALRPGLPDIEANTASDFQLQVSEDGETWTDVSAITGNSDAVFNENLAEPVTTQYVRLYFTKPTQETTADSQQNPRARVAQFELYANPKEDTGTVEKVFHEKQDILNAEIQTEQVLENTPVDMTTWLAANDNIMVTELTSNGEEPAAFEVETWASDNRTDLRPISAENDDDSVTVTRTSDARNTADENSWRSKAALSTTVIGAEIEAVTSDNAAGKGTLEFTLNPGETAYIVTAVGGGGRIYTNTGELWEGEIEPAEEASQILSEVKDEAAVQDLNQERKDWWKDYWSASYIDFGTADEKLNQVQKYYYGAQYILGSTIREGKTAPGLYGVWRTNDTPGWHGDWHLNYNFMSTFYGVNSSNRAEQSLPAAEAMFSYMGTGEQKAASTAELREINSSVVDKNIAEGDIDPENGIQDAILYPLGIGPYGSTTDDVYINECLGAGYNSYLFTSYYDYTLDESILEQSYDYLRKCANFYEAWLVKEDGKYTMYAGWCEGFQGKNPAIELATMQNVFRNAISMSEKLGVDEDKRAVWEEIYEDISVKPTWTIDGKTVYGLAEERLDGDTQTGQDFDLWGQRYSNVVMLDYFLPGDSLGYFSSPEELQIARDTLDAFDTNTSANTAWNNANNFPRVYPDAVKMRYDISTVIDHLYENISGGKMAANLRIVDGNHGVEKCGATEAINSMMLASDKGITKIFPNWYTDKDAKFSNLRAKGAFTVSAEYDGAAQEAKNVTITSEEGADMTLVSPWAEGMTVKDSEGNVVETTKGTVPNWEDQENATYTFATKAGETYTVEKGETATEKPSKNTLEYFLNKAKEHQANGDVDNCVESIKNLFAEAIAEGEAVMADENATYEEVMNATVKLMKAIQALDMKAADKTDLEMAVELAESIDLTKYVEAGQDEFQQALAAAQEVLADGDAMQADADAAWNALVDAISNLRLKADKSTLEDLLNSVADLDLSQYTEESAAVFRTALAQAQAVLADETLSEDDQKTVDDAVQALSDAKDQMQLKDTSTGDGNDNAGDGSDNTGNGDGNTGNGDSQTPGSGDNSGNNGNSNAKADAPKTGDTAMPFAMLALAAVAGTALVSFRKKYYR